MSNKKIDLYADGLTLGEFNKDYGITIDGYTFNPSIFRKSGAKDYLDYSKKFLSNTGSKPVSLEVIADEELNMIKQAKTLSSLSENVFVKIPITFTDKKFTDIVIKKLVEEKNKAKYNGTFLNKTNKKNFTYC